MGLDAWFYASEKPPREYAHERNAEEIAYFRKHHALNKFMYSLAQRDESKLDVKIHAMGDDVPTLRISLFKYPLSLYTLVELNNAFDQYGNRLVPRKVLKEIEIKLDRGYHVEYNCCG